MGRALVTGGAGFIAYLVVVLLLLRWARHLSPSIVVTASALVVYAATLVVAVVAGSGGMLFWPLSASYWFLATSFLMTFGAIHKSVSLRILLDLLDRPGCSDRYDAILRRCVEYDSYRARLLLLETDRLAARNIEGLCLTAKGRRIAAMADGCQRLFRIERSG